MELRLLFAWTLGKPTCLVDVPRYLPRIEQVGCLGRIEFRLMVRGGWVCVEFRVSSR